MQTSPYEQPDIDRVRFLSLDHYAFLLHITAPLVRHLPHGVGKRVADCVIRVRFYQTCNHFQMPMLHSFTFNFVSAPRFDSLL